MMPPAATTGSFTARTMRRVSASVPVSDVGIAQIAAAMPAGLAALRDDEVEASDSSPLASATDVALAPRRIPKLSISLLRRQGARRDGR